MIIYHYYQVKSKFIKSINSLYQLINRGSTIDDALNGSQVRGYFFPKAMVVGLGYCYRMSAEIWAKIEAVEARISILKRGSSLLLEMRPL